MELGGLSGYFSSRMVLDALTQDVGILQLQEQAAIRACSYPDAIYDLNFHLAMVAIIYGVSILRHIRILFIIHPQCGGLVPTLTSKERSSG